MLFLCVLCVLSGHVLADSDGTDNVKHIYIYICIHDTACIFMFSGPIPPDTEWTDVVKPVIEKRMQK